MHIEGAYVERAKIEWQIRPSLCENLRIDRLEKTRFRVALNIQAISDFI